MPSTILHTGARFNGPATGLTPDSGVLVIDVDNNSIKVGDGTTPGGVALSIASSVAWSSITGIPASLTAISDDSTEFQYNDTTNTLTMGGGGVNTTIVNPSSSLILKSDTNNVQIDTPNGAFVVNAQNNIDIGSDNGQLKLFSSGTNPSPALFIEASQGEILIRANSNTVDIEGTSINFTGAVTASSSITASGTISGTNLTSAGLPGVIKAFAHVDVSTPITASADYNVASVTSSATGKYDVTFTTPMPNANYVVSLSVQTNVSSNHYTVLYYNRTTTGFQVQKFLNGVLDSGASGNFSFVIHQA